MSYLEKERRLLFFLSSSFSGLINVRIMGTFSHLKNFTPEKSIPLSLSELTSITYLVLLHVFMFFHMNVEMHFKQKKNTQVSLWLRFSQQNEIN